MTSETKEKVLRFFKKEVPQNEIQNERKGKRTCASTCSVKDDVYAVRRDAYDCKSDSKNSSFFTSNSSHSSKHIL